MYQDVSSISLQLYDFLCLHIVGTEETVRTKRLMNTISDNLSSDDLAARITSGSVGEGLDLEGSDLDIMHVAKLFIVHEDTDNVKIDQEKINLLMEMNETKPGYTQLRSVHISNCRELFVQRGNSWYMSSELFKSLALKCANNKMSVPCIIHGPCVSDQNETIDAAYCLHNPLWIKPAENWIRRQQTSWPSRDVKSDITDHGVLFVPIGSKGSNYEELEWRISFSVAEKLLIYSFSHTQLLCYALMKILFKDVINSNINCKNLLSSYLIKTIIFWVSEETPVTEWKPENLVECFMRCIKRLLYCVEYSMCSHYFIPDIDMFENKIDEQSRQFLLAHLNILIGFGWRCVLFSKQFRNFTIHSNALSSTSEIKNTQLRLILTSICTHLEKELIYKTDMLLIYRRCIRLLNDINSSVIKLTYLRYMSITCSFIPQNIATLSDINKKIYYQRRFQLTYLLQNIYHDAVSGWLMLASFFYKTLQYKEALHILSNALMKCTPEKVYDQKRPSQLQPNLTTSTTLQRLGIMRVLKVVKLYDITFSVFSELVPEVLSLECLQECSFSPDAFVHFLSCLCHYRLNDIQNCNKSIRDIKKAIEEKCFIKGPDGEVQAYILLGVALQFVGQKDLATKAFRNAIQYKPFRRTTAAERFMMMYMHLGEDE